MNEHQSLDYHDEAGAVVPPRFDVVVVGAGPAGTTCAYILAQAGLRVIQIERGPYPGSKNMFGGVLYRKPTELVLPKFWEEAPLERQVIDKQYWMLTGDSAVKLGHRGVNPPDGLPGSYTVLRAKFDKWYADKARTAGVTLINSTVVTDVIRDERGKVIGVRTDRLQGDVYADVVVAADGVNSLLSKALGLHQELSPRYVALGVKEIIGLSEDVVRQRFNLEGDQGADITLLGEVTRGMFGGAFVYTNKDTISLGLAVTTADLDRTGLSPIDLMDELKAHPLVRPLIEGGQLKEYLAHLIPEGGYDAIPPLYADGFLVVGDAAGLVNSAFFEGSNHAMVSGRLAAETILEARQKHDYSARTLAGYERRLKDSVTLRDLKNMRDFPKLLHSHPQFLTLYPELLNAAAHEFFTVDDQPKKTKLKKIMQNMTAKRSRWHLVRDLWDAWRAVNLWP